MASRLVTGRLTNSRKKPGLPGIAQEADVGADVVMPAAAELAVIAVERGLERGAIAGLPTGYAAARLHHRAGGLVPQHHGIHAGRVADRALRIGMDVAAANADGVHAHLNLAGAGIFDRSLRSDETFAGASSWATSTMGILQPL